jgi:hypothetical protein
MSICFLFSNCYLTLGASPLFAFGKEGGRLWHLAV